MSPTEVILLKEIIAIKAVDEETQKNTFVLLFQFRKFKTKRHLLSLRLILI